MKGFHAHFPILKIFLSFFQNVTPHFFQHFFNKKLHSVPSKLSKLESRVKIAIGHIRGFLRSTAAPRLVSINIIIISQ